MLNSPHDPFTQPDQRWRRACWLLEHGKYARRGRDDDYTLLAKKFKSAMDRCKNEHDLDTLAEKYPGIFYAYQLRQREDQDDRWTIEARLLAGQTVSEISQSQMTSKEVVFWFEKLFFDVADKLDRKDWLANRVLGPAAHRGIYRRDYDLLLKLYALIGGPLVVDALVDQNSRLSPNPRTKAEMPTFWRDDASDDLKRSAAITLRCMPINPQTGFLLLEAHHKLLELEKEQASSGDPTALLVQNIQATLQAVPFHTARPGHVQSVRLFKGSGVERRAGEMLVAGVGVESELEDSMIGFTIPETPGNG